MPQICDTALFKPISCPACKQRFTPLRSWQKFCQPACKKTYRVMAIHEGEKKLMSKGIHFARVDKSPRLQRLLSLLQQSPRTTREIQELAEVRAVSASVTELRRNGYIIDCDYVGKSERGERVFLYTHKGRIK